MTNKSMGEIISTFRKEKGMTQKELADMLNITDKAVSKWERDISYPDTQTIPKLAEIFDVSIEELMNAKPYKNTIHSFIINKRAKQAALLFNIIQLYIRILTESQHPSAACHFHQFLLGLYHKLQTSHRKSDRKQCSASQGLADRPPAYRRQLLLLSRRHLSSGPEYHQKGHRFLMLQRRTGCRLYLARGLP